MTAQLDHDHDHDDEGHFEPRVDPTLNPTLHRRGDEFRGSLTVASLDSALHLDRYVVACGGTPLNHPMHYTAGQLVGIIDTQREKGWVRLLLIRPDADRPETRETEWRAYEDPAPGQPDDPWHLVPIQSRVTVVPDRCRHCGWGIQPVHEEAGDASRFTGTFRHLPGRPEGCRSPAGDRAAVARASRWSA